MNHTSRIEAQQRADEIRIFHKELGRLESEGMLQLAAVNLHHEELLANSCRFGTHDAQKNTSPYLTEAGSYRAVIYLP
jgi:hypothetical protein